MSFRSIGAFALSAVMAAGCYQTAKLVAQGDSVAIRHRPKGVASEKAPERPTLLVLAIDGVERDFLYGLLREHRLKGLSKLLADDGQYSHVYFDDTYLATLPSTTLPAWLTAFTGVDPAEHGITGNEFFIRQTRELAAPCAVSFDDSSLMLANFTEQYTNRRVLVPGVYQRLHQRDPNAVAWVAMHPYYAGADKLLTTDRGVLLSAFKNALGSVLTKVVEGETPRKPYAELDQETVEAVTEELKDHAAPDVLTVYLVGNDAYAHAANQGPDKARRDYVVQVLDPLFSKLHDALLRRGALANRYVIVTSDHGHTEVSADEKHSLYTDMDQDPPGVLKKAGFRVRPFEAKVADDADFQAVLAYQGAIAYVYVADRSTCPRPGEPCNWALPPRMEDVMAVAKAFYDNNDTGALIPAMKGALDLVLARKPVPPADNDLPFEVFDGKNLVPVDRYLEDHPHPTYVDLDARLRQLAVGPAGERAGDVLLIAHNGDRERVKDRYYFSHVYHSWHGSPSRHDSELPLIVAHPSQSPDTIGAIVREVLGGTPYQRKLTDLMLRLRFGS